MYLYTTMTTIAFPRTPMTPMATWIALITGNTGACWFRTELISLCRYPLKSPVELPVAFPSIMISKVTFEAMSAYTKSAKGICVRDLREHYWLTGWANQNGFYMSHDIITYCNAGHDCCDDQSLWSNLAQSEPV